MKSQNNDTNAKNIKRRAKRIKKEQNIPYHTALEISVKEEGFENWKNFINKTGPIVRKVAVPKPLKVLPKPLTVPFYLINGSLENRPNAKVSIADHQRLGEQLKKLYHATKFNRTAQTNIRKVRASLDEWIQREYPSRQELTDEVFFSIYYGEYATEVTPWPDQKRKEQLVGLCRSTISLLERFYHPCTPLKQLTYKLEQAIKAISNWPVNKNVKFERLDKQLKSGTVVFIKHKRKNGMVIQHSTYLGVVTGYTDAGEFDCGREEVSVLRKQPTASFRPLRLKLPYGKWTLEDGTEILFNKDYSPLWLRKPNGKVEAIDHRGWINCKREPEFYFDESTLPWDSNFATWGTCEKLLREWKVENKRSELMKAFDLTIKTGSMAPMEKKKERRKILGTN